MHEFKYTTTNKLHGHVLSTNTHIYIYIYHIHIMYTYSRSRRSSHSLYTVYGGVHSVHSVYGVYTHSVWWVKIVFSNSHAQILYTCIYIYATCIFDLYKYLHVHTM